MKRKFFMIMVLMLTCASVRAGQLPDAPHVYVEGKAELEIPADTLTMSVNIRDVKLELADAKSEVNRKANILLEQLRKTGIRKKDISASNLTIRPEYEYQNGKQVFKGASVTQEIEFTLKNLERYPDLMKSILNADITSTNNFTLSAANSEEVLMQAQIDALKNAKRRASLIAKSQGRKLGALYSVTEFDLREAERHRLHPRRTVGNKSGNNGAAVYEMDRMSGAGEAFLPGMLMAKATVFVVFLLD